MGRSVVEYLGSHGKSEYPGVAKFGIALDWGSRGRGFKSRHSDQKTPETRWFQGFFVLFSLKSKILSRDHGRGNSRLPVLFAEPHEHSGRLSAGGPALGV